MMSTPDAHRGRAVADLATATKRVHRRAQSRPRRGPTVDLQTKRNHAAECRTRGQSSAASAGARVAGRTIAALEVVACQPERAPGEISPHVSLKVLAVREAVALRAEQLVEDDPLLLQVHRADVMDGRHVLAVDAIERLVGVDEPDPAAGRAAEPHVHVARVGQVHPVSADRFLHRRPHDRGGCADEIGDLRRAFLAECRAADDPRFVRLRDRARGRVVP